MLKLAEILGYEAFELRDRNEVYVQEKNQQLLRQAVVSTGN
jgi:hypothetical protein